MPQYISSFIKFKKYTMPGFFYYGVALSKSIKFCVKHFICKFSEYFSTNFSLSKHHKVSVFHFFKIVVKTDCVSVENEGCWNIPKNVALKIQLYGNTSTQKSNCIIHR